VVRAGHGLVAVRCRLTEPIDSLHQLFEHRRYVDGSRLEDAVGFRQIAVRQ
jgi:hypothetical protein